MTPEEVQALFDAHPKYRELIYNLHNAGLLEKLEVIFGPSWTMIKASDLSAAIRSLKGE